VKQHPIKVVRIIARMNIGGPALHVTFLTAGLEPKGFKTVLVSGVENPGEGSLKDWARTRGVEPIVIPEIVGEASFRFRDVKAILKAYHLIRKERPLIVHTHTAKAGFVGRIAARLAGVPLVVHTYHGHVLQGYYSPLKTWLLRRMEQALALFTDRLVAVSERIRQDLVNYGVAPRGKIVVIPLGLELEQFRELEGYRGKLREELGIGEKAPLIGIVGRLAPIKNHRLFLETAALVSAEIPQARFIVVGDGLLRPELERYAAQLGLNGRLFFLGWRRDLPHIYADLDALVVSSKNEGTPVSAIEAMASGLPVVATKVGGLPDLIEDGKTGILVEPGSAEAMAQALVELLRNPRMAEQIGRLAQARVLERYTTQRLLQDVEDLYLELLSQKGLI